MKKTAMLREALREEQVLILPGAYDGVSARVIEKAGFQVAFVGGFGTAASLLGKPDVGLITLTENVSHARNIANSIDIPLLVDGEAGYGGPSGIARTIREFENAGVAGLFIEDQLHPVKCGALAKFKQIVSMDEMIMRLRAALATREDPDFVIVARTDANIVSLEEQIKRCNAYAEEGADLVMPLTQDKGELETIIKEVKAPLWIAWLQAANFTVQDLRDMGMKGLIMFPTEALFAATKVMMEVMDELKNKGTVTETFAKYDIFDYREYFSFIGLRQYIEFDQKFLD
ncbi:oxaloacetate decarboxylase [Chloroflexota bacterium]